MHKKKGVKVKRVKKSKEKSLGNSEKKKNPLIAEAKASSTFKLKDEHDVAMDFAMKAYKKFNKMIKSVVLFGSTVKKTFTAGSDIDIIIIIDDAAIKWDQELVAWYREELGRLMSQNPYGKDIHINTIKLTTWWEDLMRGDPVVLNVLRYGEALIDFGGFFEPLKMLLIDGKIKATPEAIYSALQRAPMHYARSKISELNAIEGLYWAMVDSSHAALIAANVMPPSPEHVPVNLIENFVNKGMLKRVYVDWYRGVFELHKSIAHGTITDLKGVEIDLWQSRTDEFMKVMAQLVEKLVDKSDKK